MQVAREKLVQRSAQLSEALYKELDLLIEECTVFAHRVQELHLFIAQIDCAIQFVQDKVLADLCEKIPQICAVFAKIDQLEEFVAKVEFEIARIEKLVEEFEADFILGKPMITIVNKFSALIVRINSIVFL
jgi:hypothetical protein